MSVTKISRVVFFLLGVIYIQAAAAKESLLYRFDNLTQEHGLSNNQVQCIFQDRDGWIWVGTTHGLNRFDGQSFKVYKMIQSQRKNNVGGLIRDIAQDRDGNLWVGVERGGLFRREYGKGSFVQFKVKGLNGVSVNAIVADKQGNVWIGADNGLYKIVRSADGYRSISAKFGRNAGEIGRIRELLVVDGIVWLGTDKGLYCYNPANTHLEKIKIDTGGYLNDEVWSLYLDTYSRIWIGTYNSGVYYTKNDKETITRLTPYPNMDRSQTVKAIVQDKNGDYWFGSRAGLYCFNPIKNEYTYYRHHDSETSSLGQNSILSLFVDAKGDLWVGTRGGISYLIDEKKYFKLYAKNLSEPNTLADNEVYALWAPSDSELWVGTESGGISVLNRTNDTFTTISTKNSRLASNCIKWFMPDASGRVWVSTYMGGISILDQKSKRVVKCYDVKSGSGRGLLDNRVWTTKMDSKGRIWVGTYSGVNLYDPKNDSFIACPNIAGSSQVNFIDEDSSGDIWFGTNDFFVIYNPTSKKSHRVNEIVRSFCQISKDEFLLATQGRGVGLYSKRTGTLKFYSEKDGLANDFAYSCIKDKKGGVWISTSNGLSRFDLEKKIFMNYYRVDGLQNNQFNYGAFCKTPKGEMAFGGIGGFNIFDPNAVKPNSYIPPVLITSIKIFNENLEGDVEVSLMKKVALRYNQNMITFDFAALNYAKSNKNSYKYKLEGLEEKWVDAGNVRTATYSNLAPGTYTFRVRGANSDGLWNEKEATIVVKIKPPFWSTYWFRTLIILLIGALVYYAVRFTINKENLKNKLIFEKTKAKKLQEIDSLKQQFFTNVSHEIRTPLTLIIGPVEKVLENPSLTNDDRAHLAMVRNNANQLMKLITQILDFKKLESGKVSVDYEKGDLRRFVEEIVKPFEFLSNEKGIRFDVNLEVEQYLTWIDSDKLAKILNNLLSNAFKFTPSGGVVSITLRILNEYSVNDEIVRPFYEIEVADTGSGIQNKNIGKIFSRFFQDNNSKGITGTGIGLSIVKEFTLLMNGEVDVQSDAGRGTTFYVRLPILLDADLNVDVDGRHEAKISNPDTDMVSVSNKYLLVVDDNAEIRAFLREHFKHEFTILEAENGKEGCELAVKYIPEVIISDVIMPVMDGKELCAKLKKDERTSHIPIVLLTAANSKTSEMEGLMAGADDYITKPFNVNLLNVKVDNLLQMRNALRERLKTDILLQPKNVSIASPDERFLRKAVEVVEKYMSEPDLDIERFSIEVGVSRMQLYRKLEALTNMTVKEFIRDIRLRRAAQLIEQDKISVSEVAYAVGFRDLAHFRKCFKEIYGVSPSGYLERVRSRTSNNDDSSATT